MQRRHDRKASKNRDQSTEQEKRSRINHSKRSVGRHEVQSWTTATKQSLCLLWQKVKVQLMLSMSFLIAVFWYCRRLYSFLAQLLKRWSNYLQRKLTRNLSVLTEVDLLGYSAREWKGETKQAKHMREAYEELFWSCHIKYVRQVRRDNYCVLRAVLFQIFSQGIPFPSWMKERDILKLPEKLLYSQGCNWIQQYSFGPERYTGPNAFGKLRKCMETLKTNVAVSPFSEAPSSAGGCGQDVVISRCPSSFLTPFLCFSVSPSPAAVSPFKGVPAPMLAWDNSKVDRDKKHFSHLLLKF
ncbi:inactive ubiquitin thioesterase OTULINL isoform X4 [Accipiter gentilis]|uniref:inactive ubiquitin thioesterase OTULINL isoform X4 n=1 Tax=Astur gentilis TaxID=8957 RepID=UPI00210F9E92|nr:inactive ubiquitin thioesterase OTULINL isoform X4 [Accipiter gentilis]